MSSVNSIVPDIAAAGVVEGVMSGEPVIVDTRIPVETILIYLKSGGSAREIFEDFPTLPMGGIEAAIQWAETELGPDWRAKIGRYGILR